MKKIVNFFAIALTVFAFAACNNQAAENTTDTNAAQDSSTCDTLACQDTMDIDTTAVAANETQVTTKTPAKNEVKKPAKETTTTLNDGQSATTNKGGKMQKASTELSKESTTTTKEGVTISTNNTGKMKKKSN